MTHVYPICSQAARKCNSDQLQDEETNNRNSDSQEDEEGQQPPARKRRATITPCPSIDKGERGIANSLGAIPDDADKGKSLFVKECMHCSINSLGMQVGMRKKSVKATIRKQRASLTLQMIAKVKVTPEQGRKNLKKRKVLVVLMSQCFPPMA